MNWDLEASWPTRKDNPAFYTLRQVNFHCHSVCPLARGSRLQPGGHGPAGVLGPVTSRNPGEPIPDMHCALNVA